MSLANAFFGSISLVVFGSLVLHFYREYQSNRSRPMATRNKR